MSWPCSMSVEQLCVTVELALSIGCTRCCGSCWPGGAPDAGCPRLTLDRTRACLCRDLIADIRRLDVQLAENGKQMARALDEHGTDLGEIDGIGPVTAACLIGRTGDVNRFPTAAAYVNYNGSAPVQVASADTDHHRLSRYGDRQLNPALHAIAMVQIRMPAGTGRAYYTPLLSGVSRQTLEPDPPAVFE